MKFFLLFILFVNQIATANELVVSLAEAKRMGFKIQKHLKPFTIKPQQRFGGFQNSRISNLGNPRRELKPHILDWPFELFYQEGGMGNNFAQYQPYSPVGYHGGDDMVLQADSWIYAPVNGKLEAGHYAYTDQPDGSRIKHWKPWPQTGDANYFEVAVITADGFRFELHHVDKSTLTPEVIASLNSGNTQIAKGAKIGRVVDWGTFFHYDHVHVNIHDKDGNWFNPEYFFKLFPDQIKPECKILAVYQNQQTKWVENNFQFSPDIKNFVVIASDGKNNNKFSQVPLYFSINFDQGGTFFWDFRKNLTNSDQVFADIRNVYPEKITTPEGKNLFQPGDYYPNDVKFLVNLPVPSNTGNGKFTITVSDIAGNNFIYSNSMARKKY